VGIYIIKTCVHVDLSSPFLFVFGDDRVTYHTLADDIPCDARDA